MNYKSEFKTYSIILPIAHGKTTLAGQVINGFKLIDADALWSETKRISELRAQAIKTNDWKNYNSILYDEIRRSLDTLLNKIKLSKGIVLLLHDINMSEALKAKYICSIVIKDVGHLERTLISRGDSGKIDLAKRNRQEVISDNRSSVVYVNKISDILEAITLKINGLDD